MKVVFLAEVEGTARTGDVKNVADGFARNYLLPRKLAAPATPHYISIAEAKATKEARAQSKLDEAAHKLLPKIDGKEITIEVRVGEQEKLFGSVTARDVAEQLQALTKIELEHRQVDLKQPIRELGDHPVTVKLTRNVLATVTVHVLALGAEPEAEAPPDAPEGAEPAEGAAPETDTEPSPSPAEDEAGPGGEGPDEDTAPDAPESDEAADRDAPAEDESEDQQGVEAG